ncbi:MAG: hypothetical protein HKN06_03635 [Gammaproteobacteria bacterium]|nr:hypothetical protein [Gammaproteobacteria bacterium]
MSSKWARLGRLIAPDQAIDWMTTHTGACAAAASTVPGRYDLYVSGRDKQNRSRIGRLTLDLTGEDPTITEIRREPVLELGELGAFDDNGTSYPCVVESDNSRYLYYTGWTPSVTVPFQNHLGLARESSRDCFKRMSRAPILHRTNEDFSSIGSVLVLRIEDSWRMWYTAFCGWHELGGTARHRYEIKYASSSDGIAWHRDDTTCIAGTGPDEHSICRPAIYRDKAGYHMIYSIRGRHYRLGYAISRDGITWERRDEELELCGELQEWENKSQCYPWVIEYGSTRYLLYCGNDYGRGGLGIARQDIS